ncbi:MAG: MTH1187 family thiamine-binding protein [Bacteroidales bacterium]
MSVLLDFSMFPTDKGESVSDEVARIVKMISDSGVSYKLTAMGTIIETENMEDALEIVKKAYDLASEDSNRVYASIKIDARKTRSQRLTGKVESIEKKVGDVND